MLASDVQLTPVRGGDKDLADLRNKCLELIEDTSSADPYEFNGAIETTVTGRCLKLDMDVEEDRNKYADLAAVAAVDCSNKIQIIWEEHVKTPNGGLIVYICYTEIGKIASKFISEV